MNFTNLFIILCCSLSSYLSCSDSFVHNLYSKVNETIENANNVPGLKSEEFSFLKEGIKDHWRALVTDGVLEITATDKEVRPYFVTLQGIIEHVLSNEINKSIQNLTGIIHTPMPATPLCTDGEVSKELVNASIAKDPLRLFTVKARATIVRDYLYQGGVLYIVYPRSGMSKRTESQQQIYKRELTNYPNRIFDHPLECESLENEWIGAFYLFKSVEGKLYAFAIKMTQANNPQDLGHFGLWFGEFKSDSPVYQRISTVLQTLREYSSKPLPVLRLSPLPRL